MSNCSVENNAVAGCSIHATAVVLEQAGVLIRGPSGSGKSAIAASLIATWHGKNRYARWVADDRVMLEHSGNHVIVSSPTVLTGLAEGRFCGIEKVRHQTAAVVDLIVDLVPADTLARLPMEQRVRLIDGGPGLKSLQAPAQNIQMAKSLIMAKLTGRYLD